MIDFKKLFSRRSLEVLVFIYHLEFYFYQSKEASSLLVRWIFSLTKFIPLQIQNEFRFS